MKCDVCGKPINEKHPPVTAWVRQLPYHGCAECNASREFDALIENTWEKLYSLDWGDEK